MKKCLAALLIGILMLAPVNAFAQTGTAADGLARYNSILERFGYDPISPEDCLQNQYDFSPSSSSIPNTATALKDFIQRRELSDFVLLTVHSGVDNAAIASASFHGKGLASLAEDAYTTQRDAALADALRGCASSKTVGTSVFAYIPCPDGSGGAHILQSDPVEIHEWRSWNRERCDVYRGYHDYCRNCSYSYFDLYCAFTHPSHMG